MITKIESKVCGGEKSKKCENLSKKFAVDGTAWKKKEKRK